MKSITVQKDMQLIDRLFKFVSPRTLPLSFIYGGRTIHGIPDEFSPKTEMRIVDANITQYIIRGEDSLGLEIRVEYLEYRDYAATEFVAFFTNKGKSDTKLISDIKLPDGVIECEKPVLIHGNGDTCGPDGYEWFRDNIAKNGGKIEKAPSDGTSCNGAFPYMRLMCGDFGINIGIGWSAKWKASFEYAENGVKISIGQHRCSMVIHAGETMRTPRVNFVAFMGDEIRGSNMWRRWYLSHIIPRENGQQIPPKYCMHVFQAGGYPEFTGANEQNQISGIDDYIKNGLHPDIWWIDAGWYPCDYTWTVTGTWHPDYARFPRGLAPIGKKCTENNISLLLWFEPERVRAGSELDKNHPEWMLRLKNPDGTFADDSLLNIGNKDCCDALIELIDGVIKDCNVHIYRQDFNFNPQPYWEQAESEDRIGAEENLHVQGYLRFWDALIIHNPGLWIDSCASGGRRNDLETMRRAVPLHYTDVGYGNHLIKQKQHRQMFEWIPYFRAHNMNWDDPDSGSYGTVNRPPDRFSYYSAMAPAITDMTTHDADSAAFALAREMHEIWRRCSEMMLTCDYYPLTPCRKSAEDFYAVQFHNPDTQEGFLQIISNNKNPHTIYNAKLNALDDAAVYVLENCETGTLYEYTGFELKNGVLFELAVRSGIIYFYERKRTK